MTLKDIILIHIKADGPVTVKGILFYARDQWKNETCMCDVVKCLNELLHNKEIELYDDGLSFW
jgi:hypothetical protein